MKIYSLEELSNPETYKADKILFGLARTIAEKKYSDRAQWLAYRDEITAGQHAQTILDYIIAKTEGETKTQIDATKALFAKTAKIEDALSKLAAKIPTGITLDVADSGLIIKAAWDGGDLNERLKRIGGRWNREQKWFDVPFDAAPSLARVLTNWRKAQSEQEATKAEENRQITIKRQQAEVQRQAQYAEEKRQRDVAYTAQRHQQAKAIADRRQVVAGQYKIGDVLDGKQITGFGKSWSEATLSAGQLWQECDYGRCENEPVCVNCFKCSKHCGCDSKTYCYAYFE